MDSQPSRTWRILFIDNNQDDVGLIRSLLAQAPAGIFALDWAPSVGVGKQQLKTSVFDAIVVGESGGAQQGLDLIGEILAESRAIPLILVSPDGGLAMELEVMEAGAVLLLKKSELSPDLLVRAIGFAIEHNHNSPVKSENEPSMREQELRRIIDATPALIAYVDGEFIYRLANRAYERWFDRPIDEIQNHTVLEVVGEAAWIAIRPYMDRALAGEQVSFEQQLFYSQGGPRWVHATYTPDRSPSGRINGIMIHVVDVGEIKRVEAALRETHERAFWLARLPDENPNPVARVANEGLILYCNPSSGLLNGWNLEVGGRLPAEILPLVDQSLTSKAEASGDLCLGDRYYNVWVMPFPEEKYVNVYGRDITERKEAEAALQTFTEQLQRSNQALEDFALIASHDMQEPLRKIQTFGDMLSARFDGVLGESGLEYLGRMQNAARRMSSMLDGLLAYSRVTTQGQPFQEVDLNVVMQEVLSDLEVRLIHSGGQVSVENLPVIRADALQIRQLFQNLLSNALKFYRRGTPPHITITSKGNSDWLELRIADNGIGIAQPYFKQIFQPFKRLHGLSEYEGTGMGLAICEKIVERHGGVVTIESVPGEGSVFVVRLPVGLER